MKVCHNCGEMVSEDKIINCPCCKQHWVCAAWADSCCIEPCEAICKYEPVNCLHETTHVKWHKKKEILYKAAPKMKMPPK